MAEKFVLAFTEPDWKKLEEKAKSRGFLSFREMVTTDIRELARRPELNEDCKCDTPKFKNNFNIPDDLQDFLINLSCKHHDSVSGIIYRYLVVSYLLDQAGRTD